MTDETHDLNLRSWVDSANAPGAIFPVQNLPFASFFRAGESKPRLGAAIGDQLLDVTEAFGIESMRLAMAMEKAGRVELRHRISRFLTEPPVGQEMLLLPIAGTRFTLPCPVGDYAAFQGSIHHATNVRRMTRPGSPLPPNFKWMPTARQGRASSIVLSGAPVRRPWGQTAESPDGPPAYGPSRRLDYEAQLGAFLGPGNRLGEAIAPRQAAEHLFGVSLLNDWTARDLQAWEQEPLGAFVSKSFATQISPWVITMEALEPFRRANAQRGENDPWPLPHLDGDPNGAFAVTIEVWLKTAAMTAPVRLSRGDFSQMYWTLEQMVAQVASNGCAVRPGDLIGSGVASGPEKENRGCLLELAWAGTEPVALPGGERRVFVEDGDEVILRGYCETPGYRRIGLGDCRGVVRAAAAPGS